MISKGKKKYVPPNILDELENIKKEKGITRDCDAFRKMAENSIVGREAEKIMERVLFIDILRKKRIIK